MKSDDESEKYEEILDEVEKIINKTGEDIEVEHLVKNVLTAASPAIALLGYLTGYGKFSQKTAEKMVLTVWRKWFDDAADRGSFTWHEGED